jgi:RNA polymerase sigma-70 factor (ECF subfamily)
VQGTLLACVESRDRVRDGASFRAYLLRVARSRLYDHVMRVRGGPKRPDPLLTSVADAGLSPSHIVAKTEQDRFLLLALRRLPLDLQVALELHYWEGLTTAELAEVLEIPQGTVKTRLFRARNLLREDLRVLARSHPLPAESIDDLDGWAHSLRAAIDGAVPLTPPG